MNKLRLCLLTFFLYVLHRLTMVSSNELDVTDESVRMKRTPIVINFNSEDFLDAHNEYRQLHGCPPLVLSPHISQYAQEWADKLATENIIMHRLNNPYGENIYWSISMNLTGREPVDIWYNEIALYNFDMPTFGPSGHFTQLIWKDSKRLGVGLAMRGQTAWVVANYDPPGNYYEEFGKNVPRLI